MTTNLDHLVIAAKTLEEGLQYVEETLGVKMPKGGEHPLMGTHNHLTQLGNDVFLELVAINPDMPAPNRPRWFGLDDPFIQAKLEDGPQLLTWVVNTTDLECVKQNVAFDFGEVTLMSRGSLNWLFSIPDDGRLLASGQLPYVMQWPTKEHPSRNMADLACRLIKLELFHANSTWFKAVLAELKADHLIDIHSLEASERPYLLAHIDTPSGIKSLRSF